MIHGIKAGLPTSWSESSQSTFLSTWRKSSWLGSVNIDLSKLSHAWPILLPSSVKCLGLWTRTEKQM